MVRAEIKSCANEVFSQWELLDFIPTPIFAKDLDGCYQCVNGIFADMILGLPKEEILGRDFVQLRGVIPLELAEVYHAKDLELIKRGGAQIYDSEVLCSDGKRRIFEFHKATMNDRDGSCLGIVGVMMDISARHRLEQETVANEKMRVAVQTAGAASHELSQPLQVIAGCIELCSLEPDIPPKVSQYLAKMKQAVLSARNTLKKLQNLRVLQTMEYEYTATRQILDLDKSSKA